MWKWKPRHTLKQKRKLGRRSHAKTGVQADAKAKAVAELRVEAIFTAEAGIIAKSDPIDAVAGRRRQWRQRHYSAGPA